MEAEFVSGFLDSARLVFIDGDTALGTDMVRSNCRSPRGERLIGYAPLGHCETVTFVAGLRHAGIVAPILIYGAINGEIFLLSNIWIRRSSAETSW